ncbi:type III pantothenate kinase [Microbulbifer sp. OS29]|uniref:Type III pantothenate kinase n=1 Tax=Microbulbifer okhotskensis TaxID=2926617 RepID=A0A9X2ENB3_9GAMM|nr:type III pantothenate kinase [Microbulbifer okhotskensis]MCO1334310.1 type III pantothenate kinase [Microbulbifer okhotskensis]
MILELDIGNTRGKWRFLRGAEVLLRGDIGTPQLREGVLPDEWAELSPHRVRVVNVAGPQIAEILVEAVKVRFALQVEFSSVLPECAGVVCGYDDPRSLGADRWLAMLAAYQKSAQAALIVDCGSAVTLDLLDNGGCHIGGYIVPGFGLMNRALSADTHAAKSCEDLTLTKVLGAGRNTNEAINRGLLLMVMGAVDRAMQELQAFSGSRPLLWLTGGDARLLSSVYQQQHHLAPDLVMDGLALSNP